MYRTALPFSACVFKCVRGVWMAMVMAMCKRICKYAKLADTQFSLFSWFLCYSSTSLFTMSLLRFVLVSLLLLLLCISALVYMLVRICALKSQSAFYLRFDLQIRHWDWHRWTKWPSKLRGTVKLTEKHSISAKRQISLKILFLTEKMSWMAFSDQFENH